MYAGLISVVLILTLTGCTMDENRVFVSYRADENMYRRITISVCDSSWTILNPSPGEKREYTVVYTHDDSFHVETEAADGSVMELNPGYVTHGINADRVIITVGNDSIYFTQSNGIY